MGLGTNGWGGKGKGWWESAAYAKRKRKEGIRMSGNKGKAGRGWAGMKVGCRQGVGVGWGWVGVGGECVGVGVCG